MDGAVQPARRERARHIPFSFFSEFVKNVASEKGEAWD